MRLAVAVGIVAAIGAPALADSVHFDPSQGASIVEDTRPTPLTRPIDLMVQQDLDPAVMAQPPTPNSNVIYLNNCKPNGCTVRSGYANSINDTWSINGTHTLTPFSDSDATWNTVVSCMHEVFAPFNVQIVTVDPGSADHFEIMIAGSPGDLGMSAGVGGVSPWNCDAPGGYISDSLVFDFSKVWGGDAEEICATAAQEVAHSFLLDHVADPSDPMTYAAYNGRRHFKDGVQCGSDCVNGRSPFGLTCSGADDQIHACTCTNHATQADVTDIQNLFGVGTIVPPAVKFQQPLDGQAVEAGFPVSTTVTDAVVTVEKVELAVDGALVQTLTVPPYAFNAPATLDPGEHTVKVTAYDYYNTAGSTTIHVIIGTPCEHASECPDDGDACIGGRCVAGPTITGGLGAACTMDSDCVGDDCVASNDGKFCVVPCDVGQAECPSGFGCFDTGNGGICYPGYDDGTPGNGDSSGGGGGGCQTSGGGGAAGLVALFGLAGLVWRRRA